MRCSLRCCSDPSGPDQIWRSYSGSDEEEARADLRCEPRTRGELACCRPRYGLLALRDIHSFIDSGHRIRARGKRADWRVPKAIPNTRALGCPRRDCVYRSAGSKRRAQRSGLGLLLSTELSDGYRAPHCEWMSAHR